MTKQECQNKLEQAKKDRDDISKNVRELEVQLESFDAPCIGDKHQDNGNKKVVRMRTEDGRWIFLFPRNVAGRWSCLTDNEVKEIGILIKD